MKIATRCKALALAAGLLVMVSTTCRASNQLVDLMTPGAPEVVQVPGMANLSRLARRSHPPTPDGPCMAALKSPDAKPYMDDEDGRGEHVLDLGHPPSTEFALVGDAHRQGSTVFVSELKGYDHRLEDLRFIGRCGFVRRL